MGATAVAFDWNLVSAVASVVAAGWAWHQAVTAKNAAKEALDSAQQANKTAREANDLTRMERSARANQLHVSGSSPTHFTVTNPLSHAVSQVKVFCACLPNSTVFIQRLDPNASQRFELSTAIDMNAGPLARVCSVELDWIDSAGEECRRRVDAEDIWDVEV